MSPPPPGGGTRSEKWWGCAAGRWKLDPKRSREKWNLGPKRSNSVRIGSFNTTKDRFGVGGWEKIPQKDRARSCQSEKRGSKPRHICITHHIGSTPPRNVPHPRAPTPVPRTCRQSSPDQLPGPCITNVFATRRKNFSQWHRGFQRKLLSHWLKFLRHVAITLVIQGPGRLAGAHPTNDISIEIKWNFGRLLLYILYRMMSWT